MHDTVPKYLPLPVNVTIVQEMISVKRFGLLTRQQSKENLEKRLNSVLPQKLGFYLSLA